jgi:dCMP deaminase
MELAKLISTWSKDSTKVGVVITKDDHHIISTGYNGIPSKLRDTPERLENKELKLLLTVHAEINAILHAAKHNISLDGSTMYIYGYPPCPECAKTILSTNIKKVVYNISNVKDGNSKWTKHLPLIEEMFKEAGVELVLFDMVI